MAPRLVRAVGTAFLGPARWGQRTGFVRSALAGRALDAAGRPLPWYNLTAIEFLSTLDFSKDSVLEFGSGQSTLWWSSRAASVQAVEESSDWFSYVQESLAGHPSADVHLESDLEAHANLPLTWDRRFDVVIIDGGDRLACTTTALKVINPDGLIIVDNSDGYWGGHVQGIYPILDLLDENGWMRIDFSGYVPGVLTTGTTSLFFRDGRRFLHLPPPQMGGK